jgi:hypothetical protein
MMRPLVSAANSSLGEFVDGLAIIGSDTAKWVVSLSMLFKAGRQKAKLSLVG